MNRLLTIVSSAAPDASDGALRKLAEFLGLAVESVALAEMRSEGVTAMSGGALAQLLAGNATREAKLRRLPRGKLLVSGFSSGEELALLTEGVLVGVSAIPVGKRTYAYGEELDRNEIPFAGLSRSFEEVRTLTVFVQAKPDARVVCLVSVEEQPLLVRVSVGATEVFLLAEGALPDLDATCESSEALTAVTAALLPAAVFLRVALGAAC